jgi:hypothetical protein
MDAQPIGGSATELHDLLLHAEDLTDDLQECTATIASRLSTDGAPVWCTVIVVRHRQPTTVASSSPEAEALDETRNRFPAGPCLTAINEHTVVRVGDVRDDPRWAEYHAVGIVMGRNRCSPQQAFEILKSASCHRHGTLREVAADLVATAGRTPATTHFEA